MGRDFPPPGEPADDCEERAAEWEAIRRLLRSAPRLFELLNEAETFWGGEFADDNSINGGDLVEWFAAWLPKVRSAIAAAQGHQAGAAH